MKLKLLPKDYDQMSPTAKRFIDVWKQRKGYTDEFLSLGEVIELLMATTYTFYKEDSAGQFFNNLLTHDESAIGWDGDELIDILFYEVCQNIKKRISGGRTFNQIIENEAY